MLSVDRMARKHSTEVQKASEQNKRSLLLRMEIYKLLNFQKLLKHQFKNSQFLRSMFSMDFIIQIVGCARVCGCVVEVEVCDKKFMFFDELSCVRKLPLTTYFRRTTRAGTNTNGNRDTFNATRTTQ